MRVLITGLTGFAGSHLAEYIVRNHRDVEVFGTYRWRSRMENMKSIRDKVTLFEMDLRDPISVLNTLERVRPDRIFHLAAQSYVPTSWEAPVETFTINVIGQLHLFESCRKLKLMPRIQIACSSEEYGLVHEDEIPIKETNPLRPLSPYAVSKVTQDLLGYQYFQSYGLPIVRTRGFNHTGPRRGEVFVTSNFAKQIAEIEAGLRPGILHVGNLNAVRDFTDVRDMVRAYWLALEFGKAGEVYNIASGRGISIRELVDKLVSMAKKPVDIQVDPERLRPSDVPVLIGDSTRFRECSGWSPEIPLEKTLEDLLDFWRQRLRSEN